MTLETLIGDLFIGVLLIFPIAALLFPIVFEIRKIIDRRKGRGG